MSFHPPDKLAHPELARRFGQRIAAKLVALLPVPRAATTKTGRL